MLAILLSDKIKHILSTLQISLKVSFKNEALAKRYFILGHSRHYTVLLYVILFQCPQLDKLGLVVLLLVCAQSLIDNELDSDCNVVTSY